MPKLMMMDDQQLYNSKPLERLNRKLDQNLKEIEKQRIQDDCIKTIGKMLPEDRFSEWIHSICLVTFDIEIGQRIEKIYPSNVKFTPREESNICYLSFPDSNSGCMGDTKFHFRTRLCRNRQINSKNKVNKELLSHYPIDSNFLYGFVFFRQCKDRTARRGYFQKSLVILTKYPFINLFYEIISIIAPRYFDDGEDVFIQACKDFDRFPPMITDEPINLRILDTLITTIVNCKTEQANGSPTNELNLASLQTKFQEQQDKDIKQQTEGDENQHKYPVLNKRSIPFVYQMNIYNSLLPIISHIQLIWELVITCEPIIVMASTPDVCSDVVQSLVSIISPLRFSSDYRPFFTIHDSEFKEYTTKTQAPPPVILAVTNPFFHKTLQHYPHIINIRSNSFNNTALGIKRLINYAGFSAFDSNSNSAQLKDAKDAKIHKSESIKTLDNKTGLYTKYKPYLTKDRTVLKKLFKGIEIKRSKDIQDQILRRYFQDLTQSFLMPLERYIASLMPLQKNISPFKNIPVINPFNPEDFIKSLETSGPQLTTGIKGDWSNLYKRFFRCANFAYWYESRFREISTKIKCLHIEKLCKSNLIEFVSDKDEVEVIDLILGIKQKIETIENECLPVESECLPKLNAHLKDIIETLPLDIQPYFKNLMTECKSTHNNKFESNNKFKFISNQK